MKNNNENRITEIRANTETGIIAGTAIVFNSESRDLGGFVEVIKKEACSHDFLMTQDIIMLYNHNQENGVLARSNKGKGSLKFSVDDVGVHFEFKAKKKDMGYVESIADGDINACSFAFSIDDSEGAETWEKRSDGSYLRIINKFSIVRDFSIVVDPAYMATSCNTRGLDDLKNDEQKKVDDSIKKVEQFERYYNNIKKKYLHK